MPAPEIVLELIYSFDRNLAAYRSGHDLAVRFVPLVERD